MEISKILGGAKAKADKMLQDFNKALPILKDLGLSVARVGVDVSFFPVMRAILRGSIDSLNRHRIQQLIAQHQQNKIAVTVLKGLYTAANVQNVVEGIPFKGVEVRLKFGIGFKVEVDFIRDAVAAISSEPKKPQVGEGSGEAKGEPGQPADADEAA